MHIFANYNTIRPLNNFYMKKLLSSIVLASLFFVNTLTVNAGGYCPTWVKPSEDTPERGVFAAGEVFKASTFEITAGDNEDVFINKLKILIRGVFDPKNVKKIYVQDDNGTTLGTVTKLGLRGTGFVILDTALTVEKGSTEKLHFFLESKPGYGGIVTLGMLNLWGYYPEDITYDDTLNESSSMYCSYYGELTDSVWGTLHSIVFM